MTFVYVFIAICLAIGIADVAYDCITARRQARRDLQAAPRAPIATAE